MNYEVLKDGKIGCGHTYVHYLDGDTQRWICDFRDCERTEMTTELFPPMQLPRDCLVRIGGSSLYSHRTDELGAMRIIFPPRAQRTIDEAVEDGNSLRLPEH